MTEEEIKLYIEMYREGKSLDTLREMYGVDKISKNKFSSILVENGLVIRSRSENNRVRFGYTLNTRSFSEKFGTEECSYFLGFALADGSVSKHTFNFTIKREDGYILRRLQEFLGANYGYHESSIYDKRTCKEYHRATFSVGDPALLKDLSTYGITPRKSTEEKVLGVDYLNDRHFWRGVVDGDGHVNLSYKGRGAAALVLVGSEDVVNKFYEFILHNIEGASKRTIGSHTYKNKTLYKIQITGDDARNLTKLLYKDSGIHLIRKYEKVFTRGPYEFNTDPASTTGGTG